MWHHVGGLAVICATAASCHLALGLQDAETLAGSGGGGGQTTGCTDDTSCDDDNPCTNDRCEVGSCAHDALDGLDAPVELQTAGDCQVIRCTAGEATSEADDSDVPNDGKECTDDTCQSGAPSNPPKAATTPCTEGGGVLCNDEGKCVQCYSNGDCSIPETCGGGGTPGQCGCTPVSCASVSKTCGFVADNGCNAPLDCNDGAKNGQETDVDCGGSVQTCANRCNAGKACLINTDCASNVCDQGQHICQ